MLMSDAPKVDYLKEDPPINGQTYSVVSFVNPKDMVLEKNLYYVNKFMVRDINQMIVAQATHMVKKLSVDMRKKISGILDKLHASVNEEDKHLYRILNAKYRDMEIDEDEFIHECHRRYTMDDDEILDKYKMFLSQNRTMLDREFNEAHDDVASVRGFKVRGTYNSYNEAKHRCEYVRDNVEPAIHAFVIPVGMWCPLDVEADDVQDQDYMTPALNDLMSKYHEGIHHRDQHFRERELEMQQPSVSVKSKLQQRLKQKRHQQIKRDLAEIKQAKEGKQKVESETSMESAAQAADEAAAELLAAEQREKSCKGKKTKSKSKSSRAK